MKALTEQLNQMMARSVQLCGFTWGVDEQGNEVIVGADEANKLFLKTLAELVPDPQEQARAIREAWDDPEKMLDLNALRVEQVGNYIVADSMFMSAFFEQVTLREDEEPHVVNESMHEVRVGHMGEDGTPETVKVVKPEAKSSVALRFFVSKKVRYKTLDVYRGRVDGIAQKTFDIARDLTIGLDLEHYNLLTQSVANGGCYGAFSFEQGRANKARRIYVAHSAIITDHLPPTNDYDMTQNPLTATNPSRVGNTDRFGVKVLQAIVDYADRWGNWLPDTTGRLVPTGEILVPASDISAIAADATPSSDTPTEETIQQQVNRNGYTMLSYLGRTWKFIGIVTIPSGTCFPRFNMVPGRTFFKPAFDKEFVKTDDEQNWEERWQRKVYGAHIISQHRPRGMRIQYEAD
jgi:hypothetical protein